MKIAICAVGDNLDSKVSPIFGRCPYFLIGDSKTKKFEVISNSAFQSGRGAGVGAAQIITSAGVKVVLCGNFGPNAFTVFKSVNVKLYAVPSGLTSDQALKKYNKGELDEMKTPTRAGFGFGRGLGRGAGRGLGRGFGQRLNRF